MKKSLGNKTLLYPMPVLIIATFDENNNPNAMNAAWGGIIDTSKIGICIDSTHKTAKNLIISKAFTVSIGVKKLVKECDYLGLVSGNEIINKLDKVNLTTSKSEVVNAPIINEFPLTLECNLLSYDEDSSLMIGEIKNILVDEEILDENNKIDVLKLEPISYDSSNHKYLLIKEEVGNAFKDGKFFK